MFLCIRARTAESPLCLCSLEVTLRDQQGRRTSSSLYGENNHGSSGGRKPLPYCRLSKTIGQILLGGLICGYIHSYYQIYSKITCEDLVLWRCTFPSRIQTNKSRCLNEMVRASKYAEHMHMHLVYLLVIFIYIFNINLVDGDVIK